MVGLDLIMHANNEQEQHILFQEDTMPESYRICKKSQIIPKQKTDFFCKLKKVLLGCPIPETSVHQNIRTIICVSGMTSWGEIDKRLKENKQETTDLLTVNPQILPRVMWSMDFTTLGSFCRM